MPTADYYLIVDDAVFNQSGSLRTFTISQTTTSKQFISKSWAESAPWEEGETSEAPEGSVLAQQEEWER